MSRFKNHFYLSLLLIMIFAFLILPSKAFPAYTAIYASDGNDGYQFTGCFTVSNLKSSCWNGIIMFALTVQPNGDLTIASGSVTMVHNGVYMGDPNWGSNVTALKTPPTSVTRYELCLGGWGDTSFANIQSLINSQGVNGILRTNFQALKNACPGLDAINDDDEGNYDINSTTTFGQMLNSIGMKLTQAPYTNQGFWVQLKNNLGSGCDIIYLQCYQGGAGNNPAQWNSAYGNGVHVVPGEETNYASQAQFTTWASSSGATGGFFWPDWYWCPGTDWPTQIAAGIGTSCSLAAVTPYLQVNGAAWQQTNSATVPYGAVVNLGPQDSGETWSWTGPGGFTSSSREIDSIPLTVGNNSFTVTNTTQCVCNQSKTFTITMQPPPSCASGPATFGDTADGIGCCNLSGQLDCCSYSLSQAMTVNSLQIYMGSGTNCHGVLGIYSDNAGSPGALLTQSNAMLMTSGWNTFAVPNTVLAPGTYWLSASFDSGTANFFYSNAGGGGLLWKTFSYNGSMPSAPGSGFTGYGWLMSIYASGCLQSVPTPTKTNTPTSTFTSTKTFTSTSTATFTPTKTNTPTPTSTYSFTPTKTNSFTPTATFTWTRSNTPTSTATFSSTPTRTFTSTGTSTFTPTSTASYTRTFTPTFTATFSSTPTRTFTSTGTPTNSSTPTATSTNTSTHSLTPTGTSTNTPTVTPTTTRTMTPTNTATATSSATRTMTSTPSFTTTSSPTASYTVTSTSTRSFTPTFSFTSTATNSSTSTNSYTATLTASFTSTVTATFTATRTATPSFTFTGTFTPTRTSTSSFTPTSSSTFTPTASKTFTPFPSFTFTQTPTSTPTVTSTPGTGPVIYPNPISGLGPAHLSVPLTGVSDVKVTLYSSAFRSLNSLSCSNVAPGTVLDIPLTDRNGNPLANGVYYLVVQAQGKRWIVKLMVLR